MNQPTLALDLLSRVDRTPQAVVGRVSVVIPCFNEQDGVENLQLALKAMLAHGRSELDWEIIFVDDGSTDETQSKIAEHFASWENAHLVKHGRNRGLIAALMTGFDCSTGSTIACLDADCTYHPSIINDLLAKASQGFDVVTASPYHPDGLVQNVAAWRIALSRAASWMYRQLFSNKLTCYTCMVRVYNRERLTQCSPKTDGFVGVTELLWQLDRDGASMAEVPATLKPRESGASKMQTWRTTRRHMGLMLRILRTRLFARR